MVNKISNNKDNVIRLVLLVVTDVVFIPNIFIGCLAAPGVTAVLLVRLVLILFCIYIYTNIEISSFNFTSHFRLSRFGKTISPFGNVRTSTYTTTSAVLVLVHYYGSSSCHAID